MKRASVLDLLVTSRLASGTLLCLPGKPYKSRRPMFLVVLENPMGAGEVRVLSCQGIERMLVVSLIDYITVLRLNK